MKRLRVLVLVHEDLVPPDSLEGHSDQEIGLWKTEFDVVAALRELGHDVKVLGVQSDLGAIRDAILEWKPDIAFNLLEEFHGVGLYDQHVVSYLELMKQHYTGCNPRGLVLAHDKALTKKILSFHRIPVAAFVAYPKGRVVKPPIRLSYPLIVKSIEEHGSFGIAQASVVSNVEELQERVAYLHENLGTHAMAEEYVEGRELYLAILGNRRLTTLPLMELHFGDLSETGFAIATRKVKWDWGYQERHGIDARTPDDLSPEVTKRLVTLGKRVYRRLGLSGYARIDFRLRNGGEPYVLEANPNADLAYGEEFANSAEAMGISYEELIQRVLNHGLRYQAAWRLDDS